MLEKPKIFKLKRVFWFVITAGKVYYQRNAATPSQ